MSASNLRAMRSVLEFARLTRYEDRRAHEAPGHIQRARLVHRDLLRLPKGSREVRL